MVIIITSYLSKIFFNIFFPILLRKGISNNQTKFECIFELKLIKLQSSQIFVMWTKLVWFFFLFTLSLLIYRKMLFFSKVITLSAYYSFEHKKNKFVNICNIHYRFKSRKLICDKNRTWAIFNYSLITQWLTLKFGFTIKKASLKHCIH